MNIIIKPIAFLIFHNDPIMALFFENCKNIYLQNLHFYSIKNQAIALEECKNVKIKNSIFRRGTLGLAVRDSSNIFIKGNQFYLNLNAITLSKNKKIYFYDNLITNNKYNIVSFGEQKSHYNLGYKKAYTRLKNNRIMRTEKYNLYLEKVQSPFISTQNFYGGGALVLSPWYFNGSNLVFLKENVIEPPKGSTNRELNDNINVPRQFTFYLVNNRMATSYLIGDNFGKDPTPSDLALSTILHRKDDFIKRFYKDNMIIKDNFFNLGEDLDLTGTDLFNEFRRLK